VNSNKGVEMSNCENCGYDDLELCHDEWNCPECEHVFQDEESIREYQDYELDMAMARMQDPD
jgi:hypothetical protein